MEKFKLLDYKTYYNAMIKQIFDCPAFFLNKPGKHNVQIILLTEDTAEDWIKKQDSSVQTILTNAGFTGKPRQSHILFAKDGAPAMIVCGIPQTPKSEDFSYISECVAKHFSSKPLKTLSFSFSKIEKKNIQIACMGWALAGYAFGAYKKNDSVYPRLVWPENADKNKVESFQKALYLTRRLVQTPSNDMGPQELENSAKHIAKTFEGTLSVIRDQDLLKQNLPLIYTVGEASPRRPRLIDIKWGNTKHPKVTIVGKGVAFDTGGLNLKPTAYMKHMKKDMGGAAHALGLALAIMSLKLPVRLRVLIPAVENAIAGNAFRPGDVIKSRKGLYVENTNTDAEGRLILADSLTLASEESPDLIIDFATLTGSARAALGPDIPAVFSNQDKLADKLKKLSLKAGDPVWPMPLWQPYKKHIESNVGDLVNSAGIPGDLIYSALFLEQFLVNSPPWVHFDIFAWEDSGKPGRPRGGADTGLLAAYALVEDLYG